MVQQESRILHVVRSLHDVLAQDVWGFERRVFLCGATTDDKNSMREAVAAGLRASGTIEVHYPEVLFAELLTGVGHHDLLSLENLLAEGVTAIVIVLEGAGAICELGAFANHARLRDKLIVFQDGRRALDRSFIQFGPIRLLKSIAKGRVINVNFADPKSSINSLAFQIQTMPSFDAFRITNVFHVREFLIPLLYVMHTLTRRELILAVQSLAGELANGEALVGAAIAMLRKERLVVSTDLGFTLTVGGQRRARRATRNKILDKLQLESLKLVCHQQKKEFPHA